MKLKLQLLCFVFMLVTGINAQNNFRAMVKDSATKEPLYGVSVTILNSTITATSNEKGLIILRKIPDGKQEIVFTAKGHKQLIVSMDFPLPSKRTKAIFLRELDFDPDAILINTLRVNSKIEDDAALVNLVTKEELDDETSIAPGSISHLLGSKSYLNVQRTNQLNGNDVIRMEGLDGKYTQVMRDGMPLYGGYAGSAGVFSFPALDLKQVEIINGSSSALYGSGAIGGIINLISKTPGDVPEATIAANVTSLGEGNVNGFVSGRDNKLGYTLTGGINVKQSLDLNGDGIAEVPAQQNYMIHPRLFYDASPKTQVIIGFSSIYDDRRGGDIQAIDWGISEPYPFLHEEKMFRNTVDFSVVNKHSQKHTITVKTSGSAFERDISNGEFVFNGTQYSTYSEINDVIKWKKNTLTAGVNFRSENFAFVKGNANYFGNYDYYTAGAFLQDDWHVHKKLTIQAIMRYDYHFTFYSFYLPRVSFFYKPKRKLTFSLAGGSGYKTPDPFDLGEPSPSIHLVGGDIKSAHSIGVNADMNYLKQLSDNVGLGISEGLFYVNVNNPFVLITDSTKNQLPGNGDYKTQSYGTDTYIRLQLSDVELSLGYNHTEAIQKYDTVDFNMPFNPKDKFLSSLTWSISDQWKLGAKATYIANQYLYNNDKLNDYWLLGAMVEWKYKFLRVDLNLQNLLNIQQSKYETLIEGTRQSPVFKPVWNSLEGRVINLSVKWTL